LGVHSRGGVYSHLIDIGRMIENMRPHKGLLLFLGGAKSARWLALG
jgi:hypothetical protein